MHRICERRGWRLADFEALPEWEQIEYMAFDHYQQNVITSILDAIYEGNIKLWDSSPIIDLMLARVTGG